LLLNTHTKFIVSKSHLVSATQFGDVGVR